MATSQTGKSRATRKPRTVTAVAGKAAKPSAVKVTSAKKSRPAITGEKWHEMVAIAAYYRALARTRGSPETDWLDAEAELKQRFGKI